MTEPLPADRFAAALFAERTRMLAGRGRGAVETPVRRERRLLCEENSALLAVAPDIVRAIRECRFETLAMLKPAASGIVLGVTLFEGRLVSVLSAARLLGFGGAVASEPGGVMLMLHQTLAGTVLPAPLALRVGRSLGLLGVDPLGDDGPGRNRAWLRAERAAGADAGAGFGAGAGSGPEDGDRLAQLVGPRDILAATAALDPSFLPAGA